jgi:hydrogenase maturation factor
MSCGPHDVCLTCGDVAVEMVVQAAPYASGLAVCASEEGERREVETALVGAVAQGDRLLVHADVAIARPEAESRHQNGGLEGPRR